MKKSSDTIRYTATLPSEYIDKLKELVDSQKIPSVNYAIREAVEEYLVQTKKVKYNEQMKDAAKDEAFINRTMACAEDFSFLDSEVQGEW